MPVVLFGMISEKSHFSGLIGKVDLKTRLIRQGVRRKGKNYEDDQQRFITCCYGVTVVDR
jgi:hypothetical protein